MIIGCVRPTSQDSMKGKENKHIYNKAHAEWCLKRTAPPPTSFSYSLPLRSKIRVNVSKFKCICQTQAYQRTISFRIWSNHVLLIWQIP